MLRFDEQHDFEAWLRRCPLPSKALAYAVSRTGDDSCLTVECRWRLPVLSAMANGSEPPADVQLVQANLPPVKHLAAELPTAVRAGSGACGEGAGPAAEGAGSGAGGGGTGDSTSDGAGAGCTCADAGTSVGASAEIASLQVRVRAGLGSGSG